MARNDQFQRYVEAGTAFLGMSQQRAEAIVKELVSSGEVARSQAQKAVDWLLERSQKGTEELLGLIRREVRSQVESLGLATKEDISRLEGRLEEVRAAAAKPVDPSKKAGQAKPAAPKPAASTGRATKSGTKPVKAQPSPATKGAPITKAATRKRRAGATGSSEG